MSTDYPKGVVEVDAVPKARATGEVVVAKY